MKRTDLNISIDILMFIVMMPVVGIGFLIKYVLLSGVDRNLVYGNDVDLLFWGMDRHQWGSVHLYLSFVLIFLLILHLIFHWKMMLGLVKNMIKSKVSRILVAIGLPLVVLLFAIVPLFLKPEVKEGVTHHGHALQQEQLEKTRLLEPIEHTSSSHFLEKHHASGIELNGRMTINDVAKVYVVSAQELCEEIGVPIDEANVTFGRLKRQYAFDLDELRTFIEQEEKK